MEIRKAAFFLSLKEKAISLSREIGDFLISQGLEVSYPDPGEPGKDWFAGADLIISIGGDGTFLRSARLVRDRGIPIVGIKMGGLGFLTEISPDNWQESLESVLQGEGRIESRLTLDCRVIREGREVFNDFALNEAVLSHLTPHLLHSAIHLDGDFAGSFHCDGLIVSTPTGSTAYSLSAGGPILSPAVSGLVIAPICPHILSSRPLVVSDRETVTIKEMGAYQASLALDGSVIYHIHPRDEMVIKKSDIKINFLRVKKSFYRQLREKLKWVE